MAVLLLSFRQLCAEKQSPQGAFWFTIGVFVHDVRAVLVARPGRLGGSSTRKAGKMKAIVIGHWRLYWGLLVGAGHAQWLMPQWMETSAALAQTERELAALKTANSESQTLARLERERDQFNDLAGRRIRVLSTQRTAALTAAGRLRSRTWPWSWLQSSNGGRRAPAGTAPPRGGRRGRVKAAGAARPRREARRQESRRGFRRTCPISSRASWSTRVRRRCSSA